MSLNSLTFAHAFGARYELPIPLLLFVLGGAGVVILSFILVLNHSVSPIAPAESAGDDGQPTNASSAWAAISVLGLILFVLTGIFGSQAVPENIVPTTFWLLIWIAVPLSCGVLGDWTRRPNPFAQIARLADADRLRQSVIGQKQSFDWPVWLGWWPAVGLYFVVACGELIFNATATLPAVTASAAGIYFLISAAMGLFYGDSWCRRGELFSVLFSTWGKLGWFRFGNSGRRGFAGGLFGQPFEWTMSRIVFVMLLLASVGFDGLLATPLWNRFAHTLPAAIGFGSLGYCLFSMVFFVALVVAFVGLFYGFAAAVSEAGGYRHSNARQVLAGLLPSLLPISFGYLLAHNIEYLVVNSQLMFPLIGNPTGLDSWPLHLPYPLNDSFEPNPHLLPSAFYWYVSVGLIIVVHVMAVVLAHRHLAGATKDSQRARRSEYPWVVAMVAYTMLSLWLLAQPLVKEQSTVKTAVHNPILGLITTKSR